MSQSCAIIAFAARECRNESADPGPEIVGKAKYCPELNDHGIHLPVAISKGYVQQVLGNSEMSRRADGQKFCESFDDAQKNGQPIVVQTSSLTGYKPVN